LSINRLESSLSKIGHGDLKTTLRYAHLTPHNLVDAVKALDKAPDVEPVVIEGRRKATR